MHIKKKVELITKRVWNFDHFYIESKNQWFKKLREKFHVGDVSDAKKKIKTYRQNGYFSFESFEIFVLFLASKEKCLNLGQSHLHSDDVGWWTPNKDR